MKVFNLKEMKVYPYEERNKNVFFKKDNFKTRLIELSIGEKLPDCIMHENVIFYVIKGEVNVKINDKEATIKEGDCLISGPANFSLWSENGVRILGIQINDINTNKGDTI